MVMTDPIADFLTRIRNANMVRHESFESPSSKIKENIAAILKEEGYIKDYEIIEDDKQNVIRVFMKYTSDNQRVITNLKRISKPGLRVYAKSDQIPKVLNGLGTALVSTSEGVITDKAARAKNIGGEVLAYVW
ncbi:30S ribosomal protein S8 [Aerococcus urinaeequi]|mgnify:FL=1|jgi:small subunit ribosomal protein S8|uniref:Small ribosomal subunit protein uS8 n=2 Tax=Aerococcus TaxID=1375 RepID=A0A0U4HRW7_9LACT|nr:MULTISPECIES: 30S ribosomal protein S8 [Lactobacillales]KAF3300356.1 30S ribosomal protein S8 [Carnobacterium sp. PL17RED31]ALZ88426.1 30S ribosomal protein S8 [Aerococcus urinaeequi]AMB97795.1 30S ribosomal protein S8 [Aerococcus urinaeequi]KAF3299824.1 30S ribosomal protein S8 [Carnobacterium sp. PL12RED10]KAF3302885.1 30S ribosomal protein S8 [Carnobacterium sp. PL26RED25]